jgi:predicted transcriptional regulator of viral defense system
MQSIQKLKNILETVADSEHYLFSVGDFSQLFSDMSPVALLVLLGRASKSGLLVRICKGIYIYPKADYQKGFELYHSAARLRESTFCYLSLESSLSEAGIISQIPLGCITVMTGGRSGIVDCGAFGRIEFIHTKKSFQSLSTLLSYDKRYKMWRANVSLALQDMRSTGRSMDLVDMEAASEFI